MRTATLRSEQGPRPPSTTSSRPGNHSQVNPRPPGNDKSHTAAGQPPQAFPLQQQQGRTASLIARAYRIPERDKYLLVDDCHKAQIIDTRQQRYQPNTQEQTT